MCIRVLFLQDIYFSLSAGTDMGRSNQPALYLTMDEEAMVQRAIETAERNSSAEIKLILLRHCWGKLWDKAERLFKKNRLHETRQRNAVMILLVTSNREFLIYGDRGIHEIAGQGFWDEVRDRMLEAFRRDEMGQGLAMGIEAIGQKLAAHFPPVEEDENEIDDEVTYES